MTIAFTPLTEDGIEKHSASIGRRCGECSLCCFTLGIEAIDKPKGTWCQHCKPSTGGGCKIYKERPEPCRRYACAWLINPLWKDHWYPKRCKMIADFFVPDDGTTPVMRIHVHPDCPERWREEPYYADLRWWAERGLNN